METKLGTEFNRISGLEIHSISQVSGGDICQAYRAMAKDIGAVFIKCHAKKAILESELHGLGWLKNTDTISVPKIICGHQADSCFGFIAMEWIEPKQPTKKEWERFGSMLAKLHKTTPITFGLNRNNHLGHLEQKNQQMDNWIDFFRDHRLIQQMEMLENHHLNLIGNKIDKLLNNLNSILDGSESPSHLHGDLWSGNHIISETGKPYLIDPSVYAGHREVDLAMMTLFGGFDRSVFLAYEEEYPLIPGWENRLLVYQLYYLLAHVNLHGDNWLTRVNAHLSRIESTFS